METNLQLQNKKLELIQWLSSLEDPQVVEKIFELKNQEISDWVKAISEEEKLSIQQGIDDAEAGNFMSHKEVRKMYEKWL